MRYKLRLELTALYMQMSRPGKPVQLLKNSTPPNPSNPCLIPGVATKQLYPFFPTCQYLQWIPPLQTFLFPHVALTQTTIKSPTSANLQVIHAIKLGRLTTDLLIYLCSAKHNLPVLSSALQHTDLW